jgi:hypothetical protein
MCAQKRAQFLPFFPAGGVTIPRELTSGDM